MKSFSYHLTAHALLFYPYSFAYLSNIYLRKYNNNEREKKRVKNFVDYQIDEDLQNLMELKVLY